MVRRRARKKTRRSSPRQISLISTLELFALTSIMSKGLTGYGPWEFFTSAADITAGTGFE